MENYAKKLALDHKVVSGSSRKSFPIRKLKSDFEYIGRTYDILNESIAKNVPIPPSGEWILDNYYLIEEQVNSLKKEMTLSQYQKLPSVNGVSRIYLIAKELVKFTDASITEENVENFLRAYQTKKSILVDELWMLPVMLKISLIEYMKDLCEKITAAQLQKFKVESLVERVVKNKPVSEQRFHKYKSIILDTEATSYVEYLIYCLKKFGKDGAVYVQILEEEIRKVGTTTSEVIRTEHYDLALRRVSMANCITSIRNVSRFNFVNLFENINSIDAILSKDKWYPKLDFDTKNSYRQEITRIAKKSHTSEVYVAEKLVEMAGEGEHIGLSLFGSRKDEFWKSLGIKRLEKRKPLGLKTFEYVVAIYLPTIVFSILLAKKIFVLALIPISEIFVYLTNKILTKSVRPKLLPRLEEIPEDVNTFVVVPTLLNSKERVENLMQSIERYYLGNKMEHLYFALLGDASEEDREEMPFDEEVVKTGFAEAKRLNEKYGKEIFFFLYRKRVYSEGQEKYLGYERKRGMLVEFNNLLQTGAQGTFRANTIPNELLEKKIKYVITLDADTELILDSAKKLIGIMEHPLNQPVIKNGIVTEGYGLIQPKVGISLESSTSSIFSKIYAGSGGLDLYSTAESNVYQDAFGEAIFTGKGIYNVEVFQKTLEGQIPENTVLSHDLLEGSFVRAGLASDVEVIDGFPSRVNSYMVRLKRWTRGDWQSVRWLFKGPLNPLSKYKIFDNLRRSLIEISLMSLFFCGFYVLPLFVIFFPFLLDALDTFVYKLSSSIRQTGDDVRIKNKNYLPIIAGLKGSLYRCTLELVFLPYKAMLLLEAIVVTLYRMTISKKHLLEWLTAADAEKVLGKDLRSFVREMIVSPLIGFSLMETCLIYNPIPMAAAFALFIIWFAMPYISFGIGVTEGQTRKSNVVHGPQSQAELLDIAERTWNYFKEYMNERYHYLPPDNYQNKRKDLVVPRTSSTNIGLGLLTIISAKDLGFISEEEMIDRLYKSIRTICSLEKWKGHLYNWYNIETKEILQPAFVSTVDSGNFVGYLYVTWQALEECKKKDSKNEKVLEMINHIQKLIYDTDFKTLYDAKKSLFSVGFDAKENKLVDSYYDLLASEARLASFVAIAKRDVPYKHWFSLGRTLTTLDKHKGLISWAGTMFEYFMPYVVMKNFAYTLMDETYEFCIYSQKKYAKKLDIPFGISESAYYLQDLNYNYQYKAFGIPWLGVKRGLKEEVVVSPYSSIMAIDKDEKEVLKNIKALKRAGAYSKYGFYDAIDYTPNRVGKKRKAVVKTYMAHHQALILLSINNFLNEDILKERFSRNQEIKTLEILLQERVPQNVIFTKKKKEKIEALKYQDYEEYSERIINNPGGFVNILSNDNYTLLIDDFGQGYSVCKGNYLTRFKDSQLQSNVIYLKDIKNNLVWTNSKAPELREPDRYQVEFSPAVCKFLRSDENIDTTTKIAISPEDNVEIRSVSLHNHREEQAEMDVISYLENPLCKQEDDIAHMAFQNLFLSVSRYKDACILKRKNRDSKADDKYFVHFAFAEENLDEKFDFEIDKSKVIGSGRNIANASIAFKDKVYSNEVFPNLNTILSYKTNVSILPGEKKTIHYIYGFASSEEECIQIYEKYHNLDMISRVYELAFSRSLVENRFLGYRFKEISKYNDVMGQILAGSPTRKKYEKQIMASRLKQRDLWKFGISGDLPMILLKIKNINETEILRQLISLTEYWEHKRIKVDLVLVNEEENSYEEYVKDKIYELINAQNVNYLLNRSGGIHVIKHTQITEEEMNLLYACSDIVFDAHDGLLEEQLYEMG